MESSDRQQAANRLIRVVAFTLVLSVMSATMFNIVLPEISAEYQLSYAQVSWVAAGYMLIYAVGSVLYGKLADKYKLKNLLTFGLSIATVGCLIGLASHTYWMVLLGRLFQAMGASVIPAAAMLIPVRYFSPERRGRALGITATGLALGSALGPITSALLASLLHWRWFFGVPMLALLTLPYYRKYMDDEQGESGRTDWIGGVLFAGTVALLLLAFTNGIWMLGLGSLALFILFVARIRSAAEPFIEPRLFRNKSYSLGLVIVFLAGGIGYALPFLSPLMLSQVNGLDSDAVGFAMVPAAIAAALLGRYGGKLADAKGNAVLFSTASVCLMLCFALLSTFVGISPVLIAVFFIFGQVGLTFMQIALTNSLSRTLPKEQTGVGMGLLSLLNFISSSLSAGIYSTVIDLGAGVRWNPLHPFPDAIVYSNIYFVLAVLHLGIFILYRIPFGGRREQASAAARVEPGNADRANIPGDR